MFEMNHLTIHGSKKKKKIIYFNNNIYTNNIFYIKKMIEIND